MRRLCGTHSQADAPEGIGYAAISRRSRSGLPLRYSAVLGRDMIWVVLVDHAVAIADDAGAAASRSWSTSPLRSDGRISRGGQVMLIRVVTTRADVPRTGEGIAFIHGEIQPKIAAMDGNAGFAMAVDRSSGRYVGIAAWTDPKALEASRHDAPDLIADLARRLHGSEPSVEVFDLVLAHVLKPVRLGYWGRLVRLEMPVHDLPRASQRFHQWVLALFERYDGLAAIILFANQVGGVLECITWYDSLHVLRGSASRTQELRDLLVAEIPTINFVEDAELEAVIIESDELSRVVSPPYTWS